MKDNVKFPQITVQTVCYFGGIQYLSFCIALFLSDTLVGGGELSRLRAGVAEVADILMFVFPNCMFPLIFGALDSWIAALTLVGIANVLFWWGIVRWIRARGAPSWRNAIFGYLILSLSIYVTSSYSFFSLYFMRPSS